MSWRDTLETFILEKLSVTKYHKHYKVTVMALKGDVADVLPESDDIKGLAGLQNVPVYWGTPGVKATISPGATATLFFEDGDKKKPRIMNWQTGAITITLADGTLPVARVGDTVTITSATAGPYPVVGTGIIAAGNPQILG